MFLVGDLHPWLVRCFAAALGAIWGSFFNVAIYRWPREMSVVRPPSHCPGCSKPIRAAQNIPIVSYLMLRGRAACCGAKIPVRYLVVELLSAALLLAIAERVIVGAPAGTPLLDVGIEACCYFAFAGGLLVATFVDLEFMEIPDEVTLPGAALGLATAGLRDPPGALDAAIGAGAGFLVVQVVFIWGYERVLGRRGMGEGDAKLLLFVGAFLGTGGAAFTLLAGAVQGLVFAALSLLAGRSPTPTLPPRPGDDSCNSDASPSQAPARLGLMKVPFGPFLALAAIEYYFFGEKILAAYFDALS